MENKMMHISCEKDLEVYEKHLNEMTYKPVAQYKGFLRGAARKVGKLLEVNEDYIVLKMGEACVSTVIPMKNIHFITVAHRNESKQMMR